MKEYKLVLSEDDVNLILNALAQNPYYVVASLIDKLQKQCSQE